MLVHRFRELLEAPKPCPAEMLAGSGAAFAPCPLMLTIWPGQQAQVEYLYRLAYEQAQAQVAAARRQRWQGYSLN
jgi:hypothetical protein